MGDAGARTQKARAEVDNVIDEVVQTIENGVTHPDGSAGFEPGEADRLRARLRVFAEMIMDAARGDAGSDLDAPIDAVVETIGNGVLEPSHGSAFGPAAADELRAHFRMLADAIVAAARNDTSAELDAAIDQVVKTLRSGLFYVYGRASYAAITADQLEAYLETFVDAVLTVVEKDQGARVRREPAPRGASA